MGVCVVFHKENGIFRSKVYEYDYNVKFFDRYNKKKKIRSYLRRRTLTLIKRKNLTNMMSRTGLLTLLMQVEILLDFSMIRMTG